MSEFYAEPELTAEQEVAILRAKVAIYTAENDALRSKIEVLKEKTAAFAERVRQLEFEMMASGAQRSSDTGRMERIIPHDAVRSSSGGAKPGL